MYGVGKRKAYKALKCVQHNDMDLYGESQNITVLSESCLDQARQLIIKEAFCANNKIISSF